MEMGAQPYDLSHPAPVRAVERASLQGTFGQETAYVPPCILNCRQTPKQRPCRLQLKRNRQQHIQHHSASQGRPRPKAIPRTAWQALEGVNLEEVLREGVQTVKDVPFWFRGSLKRAFLISLREWRNNKSASAWKLFLLTPRMLLRPTEQQGETGKRIFTERMAAFETGKWLQLIEEAAAEGRTQQVVRPSGAGKEAEQDKTNAAVLRKVQGGELSRAWLLLDSLGLAPGTRETLAELRNPELRPPALTAPLPEDTFTFTPNKQLQLKSGVLMTALKSAGRGSARDLAGMRCEHLRVLLDDEETWQSFVSLAEALARAEVPEEIAAALALGRLTALKKESGRVRGIVAGAVMRRLVGKALAKDFGDTFLSATWPFQYALQTRAGTDAVGQALRLLTDAFPDLVVVSLDGVGAFDHVQRSSILKKLLATPELHCLVPYVRLWYARQSRFLWTDDKGVVHEVVQGEGGEQGDPLMPVLFALALHDSLVAARHKLHEEDFSFAFLDDLYVVTMRERARQACDVW